ncbi:hypothetical protein Tcan_10682 [Toxocara canis]|uniref:Uncharacterized protein n=1 Tax=Toxocara canis TaxID=6265 RepID=A0A0B2V2W1_TOXCA|nr:hypothetical protein Tcan_10682 [Toxocara canis]
MLFTNPRNVAVLCAGGETLRFEGGNRLLAMKKVRADGQTYNMEGGCRARVKWPSKSSILETPERERYRHSTSFADSGLGSSLFGSPPTEQIGGTAASPILRTPTTKASCPSGSESTPSPLRSFIHISSYSASFSSPELWCAPSGSNLRLSNPANATGFRFSGASMRDSDLRTHGRPLCDVQQLTSSPTTSRPINRFLELPATTSTNLSEENIAQDGSADVTIPYSQPETPSKGFGIEMLERKIFEEDAFSTIATSTPLRDDEVCFTHLRMPPIDTDIYHVPEQANGPLESSICDPSRVGSNPPTEFLFPPNTTPRVSPIKSCSVMRPPLKMFTQSALSTEEGVSSSNDVSKRTVAAEQPVANPRYKSQPTEHIFRTPKRRFKPFSKGWMKIACGGTAAQIKMTRLAHEFLGSRRSNQASSDTRLLN